MFDADEESVLEAATFFSPELSMPQKLRWLLSLRDLHIAKSQWAEAGESLILAANAIIDALPHLSETWMASPFDLWHDFTRSPWLVSIGSTEESKTQGWETIAEFANSFLEPIGLSNTASNRLSVEIVCTTLSSIVDQAFLAFDQEGDLHDLAYSHFEALLQRISPLITNKDRHSRSKDLQLMRRVRGNICAKLARLDKNSNIQHGIQNGSSTYVRVILRGMKPIRFKESTTIPTFLEWNNPSICRVSTAIISKAKQTLSDNPMKSEDECICSAFAEKYTSALKAGGTTSVILRIGATDNDVADDDTNTYIDVAVVQMKQQSKSDGKSRKFFIQKRNTGVVSFGITEYTVAHKFPHALSRQRSLTNNIMPDTKR